MTDPLSSCGDGVIYGSEDCDGTNLSGNECTTLGFIDGVLSCDPITCQFDTSECHSCGNAAVDDPEECDGADLGGSSCIELSFGGGQLACNSSCAFDTSGCIPCDAPSNPPGDATCPDACDTCVGNVCVINCGADECEDLTMQCPADFNCEIHCVGNDACRNGAIGCPAEADCSIECAGDEACENTSIDCGAGLCSLECDATNQSCRNTDLTCGDRECAATCGGASNNYPSVSCGNACSCTPCGA
jgi:hypothetical protein